MIASPFTIHVSHNRDGSSKSLQSDD